MQIPDSIEAVIVEFDQKAEPFDMHAVQAALSSARTKLEDKTEASDAWADIVASCVQAEQEDRPPWNTYFGPMGSGTRGEAIVYFPDIRELTAEIVDHWETRADNLTHPVLRGRYADLVWDLSRNAANRRADIRFAQLAIDSYVASVADGHNPEAHDDVEALKRALQLAISIKDSDKTALLKAMMLTRFYAEVETDGWWRHLYSALTENRRSGLTADEKSHMVKGLEQLLTRFTSEATFDPHSSENVANYLLPYYSAAEDFDSVKRIGLAVSQAFEKIANAGSRMQAMAWLQTAAEFARRAGETDRVKELRVAREGAIRDSASEMKPFTYSQEISKAEIEEVNNALGDDNWEQNLFNIAAQFIIAKQQLRHQAQETSRSSPMMALFTTDVVAEDHVAARVGGADDEEGSLYRHADIARQANRIFLSSALNAAVERHRLSAEEIAAFSLRTNLFTDFPLVKAGIRAWLYGDYVKCLFVLVPQIEDAFRSLARNLGESVTKEKRGQRGWEVSVNLGDILAMEKVKAEVGEDVHFWFKSIFADARGMNLRNLVAHGLASREVANYVNCELVIHSMLILGAYRDVALSCVRRVE
ncbi:DUF4209 domain-containing protein [uncultured Hoeflea sp.]|uniref:DUF4209 domain-containing protein n=1 Tax=uncultured Hoeflea sp. TaxID=538666 RepID=UPI0030DD4C88|tara:strand:+ start:2480 stop:4249 length:1770 start_codon:yes stop_codon:yes gene_type:complete